METAVLKVDPTAPEPGPIEAAAAVLRAGGLVAFPTETVYGLGANALDADAVAGIFAAKGRPGTNPLIVHIADVSEVLNVAAGWPETAQKLAARFWPGPLTLVLPKRACVPDVATAGGPTVAVRYPDHPVARALIRAAGVPLAAPSANRSTELSPTRAEHVLKGLNGRIAMVLDGGPCSGGLESTVVDVTGDVPRVLRPGLITVPMLEAVCGPVAVGAAAGEGAARAPGQMPKHYSPRTPMRLVPAEELASACQDANRIHRKVAVLFFAGDACFRATGYPVDGVAVVRGVPGDARGAAVHLYDVLHQLDQVSADVLVVELPPDTPEWAAVRDRLTRAAAP